MFEDIRQAFREMLMGNVAPEERRDMLQAMKESLVHARMARDDFRQAAEATRRRLEAERSELETIRRRKGLAERINDAETTAIASRFEAQHSEKVAVLEKRLEAEEGELALVDREVEEMTAQLKAARAGVGSGLGETPPMREPVDPERAGLERELESLDRSQRRATTDAEADARLAELKRRMGK